MTSRLNTTRGSQLVAKQWRRCALGDRGQEAIQIQRSGGLPIFILEVRGQLSFILVLFEIPAGLLPVSYYISLYIIIFHCLLHIVIDYGVRWCEYTVGDGVEPLASMPREF